MWKLRVLTLVSLLVVAVAVGCTVDSSSTDQAGVIETAVASGLETALAGNVEPTATAVPTATSTPEPDGSIIFVENCENNCDRLSAP